MDTLNETIKSFWEIESLDEKVTPQSEELKYCDEHFKKTHYRNPDGKYVVQLPFKPDITDTIPLGDSYKVASLRLNQLWKRLDRDAEMKKLYSDFMKEYEDMNHMKDTTDDSESNVEYFLPHHGVYRPQSSTTKLRVVFNASSKTSNGQSLNDLLLKGGIIQDDLFSIMLRFRTHKYAFSADIQKMFRQIWIEPSQSSLQRILWKSSRDGPIRIYNLQTVTYGTTSAPYLATRTLHQLALDERESFPLAAAVVVSDFYMDDCLSGSSDLSEAMRIQTELMQLLSRGGMKLHKYFSNHPDLQFGDSKTYPFEISSEESSVKTLGMQWKTSRDIFVYSVSVNPSETFTKRSVLSVIARLYDPLGLIGPVISKAKIFLQGLWLQKLNWEDTLPASLTEEWRHFVASLKTIESLKIPRWILSDNFQEIILCCFADASEAAYGTVIYVQCIQRNGCATSQLVASKSRVSPLKTISIPRLELCACLLAAKLAQKVRQSLKMKIDKTVMFTDSTICLAWIQTPPHKLKSFVANRVAKIQTLSENYLWKHVPSSKNPADIISRGVYPDELSSLDLWWFGPSFLKKPVSPVITDISDS